MIEFTHETTRYKVKPERAQEMRALAAKPPKIKRAIDCKHDALRRDYPAFYPGMETSEYLSRYASLNNRLLLSAWKYDHLDRAAPLLDATIPEVSEEIDPDYIEPMRPAKPFKATAAQLRGALVSLIEAIEERDPELIFSRVKSAKGIL